MTIFARFSIKSMLRLFVIRGGQNVFFSLGNNNIMNHSHLLVLVSSSQDIKPRNALLDSIPLKATIPMEKNTYIEMGKDESRW